MRATDHASLNAVREGNVAFEQNRQIRVLHVVGTLNMGGIEIWLRDVFNYFDPSLVRNDVFVNSTTHGVLEGDILAAGVRIVGRSSVRRPITYVRDLRKAIGDHGPYDVVHSHVRDLNGFVLQIAKNMKVPVRISHTHNSDSGWSGVRGRIRSALIPLQRRLISHAASMRLACSEDAGRALYGPHICGPRNWSTLLYGIDLVKLGDICMDSGQRRDFGVPRDALVVGHVGRFHPQKNHKMLIDIFAELKKLEPAAHLVLIGVGVLESSVRAYASVAGLADSVTFAGTRDDVYSIMLNVFDVFLFPSRFEGLGLALVEAQAAGLPCICSDVIPNEATVIPELVTRVSLESDIAIWAEAILDSADARMGRAQAILRIAESDFSVERSVARMSAVYREQMAVVVSNCGGYGR